MSTAQFPGHDLSKAEDDFRQLAIVAAKALISIGLIAFLASRLDYSRLLSYLRVFNGVWIVGALAVLIVEMCAIAGVRLNLMLVYVDARRKLTTTMQIAPCGFFSSKSPSVSSAAMPSACGC